MHTSPSPPPLSGPGSRGGGHSDEEIILASSTPKKRAGRKKFKETRHPVYRGIRKRNTNKWVCELREPNKKTRIWLGTYPTAEMAARAHDVAALAFKGQLACLNFADSVWRLPVPVSKQARDIRKAAAEAAEAFRPPDNEDRGEVCDDGASSSNGTVEDNAKEMIIRESGEVLGFHEEGEGIFYMQGLMGSMAEWPLLSPPPCLGRGFSWDDYAESDDGEVSLWSY